MRFHFRQKIRDKKVLEKLIVVEAVLIVIITFATLAFAVWYWPMQNQALPVRAMLSTARPTKSGSEQKPENEPAPTPGTVPDKQAEPIEFPEQSLDEILAAPTTTPPPADQPTPKPHCGGPPAILILGIGTDTRNDDYNSGLADVIRVARVDFVNPKVTVVAIPRDLWVLIPGIYDHTNTRYGKLNQAYSFGHESLGYYDGPDGSAGLLMNTLAVNFDLQVENYVTLNMFALERIIDAVDGIDVYVPYDVYGISTLEDDPFDLGFFPKGYHHFDGETATRFARIRLMDNVFQRSNRQSIVLYGLQEKILSPDVLPHIPQLILALEDSVQTNLSPAQISQLICLAPKIKRENLIFTNMPTEIFKSSRTFNPSYEKYVFTWEADFEIIRQLLELFENGFWPTHTQ